jgi:hypothetical protein
MDAAAQHDEFLHPFQACFAPLFWRRRHPAQQLGEIDCSTWARTHADVEGGVIYYLKPVGERGLTGFLPGENPPAVYQYHSVVVREGMVFDQLHPRGIGIDQWFQQSYHINNLTPEQFHARFDFDTIPHQNVSTR